jgi:hypothetical protein
MQAVGNIAMRVSGAARMLKKLLLDFQVHIQPAPRTSGEGFVIQRA